MGRDLKLGYRKDCWWDWVYLFSLVKINACVCCGEGGEGWFGRKIIYVNFLKRFKGLLFEILFRRL